MICKAYENRYQTENFEHLDDQEIYFLDLPTRLVYEIRQIEEKLIGKFLVFSLQKKDRISTKKRNRTSCKYFILQCLY